MPFRYLFLSLQKMKVMQVVSAREFRANQGKYLIKANEGQSVLLTSRYGNFKIVPISEEDNLTTRICRGLQQVKLIEEGKLPRRTIEDLLDELWNYTDAWFSRSLKVLAKRHRSLKQDMSVFVSSLKENPLQGTEIAPNIRKVRLTITSKGKVNQEAQGLLLTWWLCQKMRGMCIWLTSTINPTMTQ